MRVPRSGCQSSRDPPAITCAISKTNGHNRSTMYFLVSVMSWIISGLSTPSSAVGSRKALPSAPTTDQVRYGGSNM